MEGSKKEAPPKEGLPVLLHGGGTADSESSLFAVAGHVLGCYAEGYDRRKHGLRGRSCVASRSAGPVDITRQARSGCQGRRIDVRGNNNLVVGA